MKFIILAFLLINSIQLFANDFSTCSDDNLTFEQILNYFEPGEIQAPYKKFESVIYTRTCHSITGCKAWEKHVVNPVAKYKNDVLWRCSRCTSTRYSSSGQKEFKLPQDAFLAYFGILNNDGKIAMQMAFNPQNRLNDFSGQLESIFNSQNNSFHASYYSPNSFKMEHAPRGCVQVGMDRECVVGNYYSQGRMSFDGIDFTKTLQIKVGQNCSEIIFEGRSSTVRTGLYKEAVWVLRTESSK